ncbi:DNA replication/repair protein RecF [Streptococcus sp. S784/96/1]|uniref:DNA replication/repair protein RecF n=1 Tax=Streptococcus sp. S784/96/1 TaxID=2653499 RepID=UPI00138A14CE|nr:DNA replication/repair protein RecF [Streptococcus sp. S784/96/1]
MWIESISLTNYRNYRTLNAEFSPGLNLFIGENAQGKTNFLEAIYFLSLTRSHRTRSDKELVHFNEVDLKLTGVVNRVNGKVSLDIILNGRGRTTKVNHLKQAKLSDYIGTMTVVLFAPEDLQLVKGSPALRRKFIDIDLGQIKPLYLSDLSNYNHILKQRNSYLKNSQTIDDTFLDVLDEQLVYYGTRVMEHRFDFVKDLEKEADKHHYSISNKIENLKLNYISSIKFTDNFDISVNFIEQLKTSRSRDIYKKNTGVGPHRDDLEFYINEINAIFGSQGQQRSLILSLKMAEIALFKKVTGDNPILLLDDVMSELDNNRQSQLLYNIISENVQTFITTTSLEHLKELPKNLKVFYVKNGSVRE